MFYNIISNLAEKKKFPIFSTSLTCIIFIISFFYGKIKIFEINEEIKKGEKIKIGVVEADVGIWEKEAKKPTGEPLPPHEQVQLLYYNLLKHQFASKELEEKGAQLIVWPESSYIPVSDIYVKVRDEFALLGDEEGNLFFRDNKNWNFKKKKNLGSSIRSITSCGEEEIVALGEKNNIFFLKKNENEWKKEILNTEKKINAIYCDYKKGIDEGVVVAGSSGFVSIKEKQGWKLLETGVREDIIAISGNALNNLYFVTLGGYVLKYNGKKFKKIFISENEKLNSIYFENKGSIWIAGSNGSVFHLKNEKSFSIPTPTSLELLDIYADENGVFAVGEQGIMLKYQKGEGFVTLDSPTRQTLRVIKGDGFGKILIGGDNGTLIEYSDMKFKTIKVPHKRRINAISFIDFFPTYPMPYNVKYLFVSKKSLPLVKKFPDAVLKDKGVSVRDRNSAMRGFSKPLLFGAITYKVEGGKKVYYNSALLMDERGKILGVYDKNYLLIFGEYMPFGDIFPKLYEIFPEGGNFKPGKELKVFNYNKAKIGIMICYEDILPRWTRKLSGKAPNVLINLTNDAWFGKTSEPYLHLALSVFRSVENRLFLIRSTNTGVSAVIDPTGKVLQQTSIYNPETLFSEITLLSINTFYRKFGDIFAYFFLCISLIIILAGFFRKKI